MLNCIKSIQVVPSYQLQLTYDDDKVVTTDFQPIINQGGIFSPLANPEFFRSATLDAHGRAVVWPGELEFCADALRLEGERQKSSSSSSLLQSHKDEQMARMFAEMIVVEDI